jgi:hypothetical protein
MFSYDALESSQIINNVHIALETNVSKISFSSIIRVDDMADRPRRF